MRILPTLVAAALLACGASASAANDNGRAAKPRTGALTQQQELYRGSRIIGAQVRDPHGRKVGEVKDLLLDSARGEVAYAVVDFTGAGGRKLHPVPWPALVPDDDGKHYVLAADREVIGQAPGFTNGRWPDMSDQRWNDEIDRYWNRAVGRAPFAAQPGADTSGTGTAPSSGASGASGPASPQR